MALHPGIVRAQVIFQGSSLMPHDRYVNTFHFIDNASTSPVGDDVYTEIQAKLVEFYNTAGLSGHILSTYLSNDIVRTTDGATISCYDLGETLPREPHTVTWTPAAASSANRLPNEVACCASFYGGRNLRRQRGRIYFGPLNVDAANQAAGRPHAGMQTALLESMERLSGYSDDTPIPLASWGLLSEAGTGGFHVIDHGWVDDAWDTQRRRGLAAASRAAF